MVLSPKRHGADDGAGGDSGGGRRGGGCGYVRDGDCRRSSLSRDDRSHTSGHHNDGDLGQEPGSSEGIKAIVTSMLTAGVVQGLSTSGLLPENLANATNGSAPFADQLEDELRYGLANALLNTVAAQGAFEIGELGPQGSQRLDAFTGSAGGAAQALTIAGYGTGFGYGIGGAGTGGLSGLGLVTTINAAGEGIKPLVGREGKKKTPLGLHLYSQSQLLLAVKLHS
ncbi:hypothetical protein [Variovorax sp. JS1663]|uniref:hypothetical protein n=1 Tax=Variovorax sp. JS1663 TaxID=1851577 RepID=UPI000B637BCB|nr:hypothetical protein [Variovorax sp. JS1663]OUL99127.1 hypothetical protein A8M77_27825 [Variovorax sp. JS1663]